MLCCVKFTCNKVQNDLFVHLLMHSESNFTNETHIWNKNQTKRAKTGELRIEIGLEKQNHHTNRGSTTQIPKRAFHLTTYTVLFAFFSKPHIQ